MKITDYGRGKDYSPHRRMHKKRRDISASGFYDTIPHIVDGASSGKQHYVRSTGTLQRGSTK